MKIRLYTYFRSTAAYRVRIGLNFKEIEYEPVYINLKSGDHLSPEFRTINEQGLLPVLEHGDLRITQSGAILGYLQDIKPEPSYAPDDLRQITLAREICLLIANDIHPLNNLRVLKYLTNELGVDEAAKMQWYHHWIHEGFRPLEKMLLKSSGKFCLGDKISMADICLIPQVYNANRFKVDMSPYPTVARINEACLRLEAFHKASPESQKDCPADLQI